MSGEGRRRRHSAAVYRRRRITLLLAIAVIAVGIWVLIAQPWRGAEAAAEPETPATQQAATALPVPGTATPTPEATPEPTASADPQPSASATPEATPVAQPCIESDLTVEAVSDKASYATGENPQFSIRLTNDGETDCTLNVGTTTQVFTVTSGSDTWWRSTDCQTEPSDMVVTLAAGQTVASSTPLEWDRTRSSVDSCDSTDRPRAAGSGATYWLDVEIGGIPSVDAVSFQLY